MGRQSGAGAGNQMIKVTTDPARKLVRAVMSEMLTVAQVDAFSRDEIAAVRQMGLASGEFDLLIETRGNLVQTQEVMHAFQRLMLESPLKARRIATVRAGALSRMQSRRVSSVRSSVEVFETLDEAEAWLAA